MQKKELEIILQNLIMPFIKILKKMELCFMQHKEKVLSDLRLQQAYQCLASAKMLMDFGDSRGAVNRAYYAI